LEGGFKGLTERGDTPELPEELELVVAQMKDLLRRGVFQDGSGSWGGSVWEEAVDALEGDREGFGMVM
jgi:hypothetical protein